MINKSVFINDIRTLLNNIEIGPATVLKGVTSILYVSPTGNGTDGLSWTNAFTAIQDALNIASTSRNDCTLIMISPHITNYDIHTAGDPTWTGNYILKGTYGAWSRIVNNHPAATSIMKFTGRTALIDLNFYLGSSNNGVIMTRESFQLHGCQFVGEDLTSGKIGLDLQGGITVKYGTVSECVFIGEGLTHMTAIKMDYVSLSNFEKLRVHNCKTGVQIVNTGADKNLFFKLDFGDTGIGFDIDAGNEQHLDDITFHHNTTNIDDEIGDHIYANLKGNFKVTIEPDNLVGVTVNTGAAGVWGADTEIRAAATSLKPFRIVAVNVEPSTSEWYQLRLSDDAGTTFFDIIQFDGNKREGLAAPVGTEYIFNVGSRISASARNVSGGDTVKVWLEIQEV